MHDGQDLDAKTTTAGPSATGASGAPGATPEERELVRPTLRGDREAFRLIVLRHQASLAELVLRHRRSTPARRCA